MTQVTNNKLWDLTAELDRIGNLVGSEDAKKVDQFITYYKASRAAFKGTKMKWVRFETFEEFRDALQGLLYTTLFYSATLTNNENGISEHTGYTDDYCHSYSWWRIQDPGHKPFTLDGQNWDTDVSLFEIRQSIERGANWYEVRLRVDELVNMRYTELQDINKE